MSTLKWIRLIVSLAVVGAGTSAAASTLPVRPITFVSGQGYSMVASGTITTVDASNVITDWNVTVTKSSHLATFAPNNTVNMSYGDLSCDGTNLLVGTSPDGFEDGGKLFFRSPNPHLDVGVAVADFTALNVEGGQAMYMSGGVFDFLPLNQPNNSQYVAATRSSGNVFDLVPVDFYGVSKITGTITTDGTTGPLAPGNIVSWNIFVDEVIEDTFSGANSTLLANLVDLGAGGALTAMNPDGYLSFSKGSLGGHPYALTLADFTSQAPPGGQAGYYHGRFDVTTIDLHAPFGPWFVTDGGVTAVDDRTLGFSPLRVLPNPARTSVQVEYEAMSARPVNIELFDLSGRRVHQSVETPTSAGNQSASLDVSDLLSGIYFCRVQSDGGTATAKFVVRR